MLKIEFVSQYDYPGFFVYELKLTNEGNKSVGYDMSLLRCNAGKNVLLRKPEYKIGGEPLLGKGTLGKDESITGLVCFVPNGLICTNTPVFIWDGKRLKVRKKKQPKGKKEA